MFPKMIDKLRCHDVMSPLSKKDKNTFIEVYTKID